VMLVDSDDLPEPVEAFDRAEELREYAYVVDLAWLRTTPWRERLAASFDVPGRLVALKHISELEVRHQERSSASGLLLAGWMASRLHWGRARLSGGIGMSTGSLDRDDDQVTVELRALEQESPGLVGVMVTCTEGTSLALQRGFGGLDAAERTRDGQERHWKILGASRGEGGILGEGIRQALLRDPTYMPALNAARELCPV
jgi:hypothetical protein